MEILEIASGKGNNPVFIGCDLWATFAALDADLLAKKHGEHSSSRFNRTEV